MSQVNLLGEGGGVPVLPAGMNLTPPHGLAEIVAAFGDIHAYIRSDGSLDPKWQADFLTRIDLPFPLRLAWDMATQVTQMTCHKRMAAVFAEVFQSVLARGLQGHIQTLGGCFSFRPQRTGSKLSTHAWGIAIDLNPTSNAQGTAGDMDAGVVAIFRDSGLEWGGEWEDNRRDPMHFQFCTGY